MIIRTKFFPFGGFKAITIWPFIFVKGQMPADYVINHEKIHLRQQAETLLLLFYIIYGVSWLVQLIKLRNAHAAYRNVIFEREAYDKQRDMTYLDDRPFWAWLSKEFRN